MAFTNNGNQYHLKYNLRRIGQIEEATGKGIMQALNESQNMLPISHLMIYAGYAMFNEDGNRVSIEQGLQIAEDSIVNDGYAQVMTEVLLALDRDCPFLFRVD